MTLASEVAWRGGGGGANEEGALPSEIAAESASSGHTIRAEEKNLQMWSSGLLFTGLIW